MVRMWMCEPRILCRQHLLGEYKELFMIVGNLAKKRAISGYIKNNCIEPIFILSRYNQLVAEMLSRGYRANAQFTFSLSMLEYLPINEKNYKIDSQQALSTLLSRCPECRRRYYENCKINEIVMEVSQ